MKGSSTTRSQAGHRHLWKGITYDPKRKSWKARIHIAGKECFIGRFPTSEGAALAYDQAVRLVTGGDMSLRSRHMNFPDRHPDDPDVQERLLQIFKDAGIDAAAGEDTAVAADSACTATPAPAATVGTAAASAPAPATMPGGEKDQGQPSQCMKQDSAGKGSSSQSSSPPAAAQIQSKSGERRRRSRSDSLQNEPSKRPAVLLTLPQHAPAAAEATPGPAVQAAAAHLQSPQVTAAATGTQGGQLPELLEQLLPGVASQAAAMGELPHVQDVHLPAEVAADAAAVADDAAVAAAAAAAGATVGSMLQLHQQLHQHGPAEQCLGAGQGHARPCLDVNATQQLLDTNDVEFAGFLGAFLMQAAGLEQGTQEQMRPQHNLTAPMRRNGTSSSAGNGSSTSSYPAEVGPALLGRQLSHHQKLVPSQDLLACDPADTSRGSTPAPAHKVFMPPAAAVPAVCATGILANADLGQTRLDVLTFASVCMHQLLDLRLAVRALPEGSCTVAVLGSWIDALKHKHAGGNSRAVSTSIFSRGACSRATGAAALQLLEGLVQLLASCCAGPLLLLRVVDQLQQTLEVLQATVAACTTADAVFNLRHLLQSCICSGIGQCTVPVAWVMQCLAELL